MIQASALAIVYEHAIQCYPRECCGFILASGGVYKATNQQDRLHDREPRSVSRNARTGFSFSPKDLLALNRGLSTEDPPVIIYHSHPDVGAYFSDSDAAGALYGRRLVYNVDFLVIDVRNDGAKGQNYFATMAKGSTVWSESLEDLRDAATQWRRSRRIR